MRDTRLPDPRAVWTEEDARCVLHAQRRSGEAIAGFARAHGIAASRLYWWKKRLSPSVAPISTMTLVPAAIVADDAAAVVIRMPGGIEIEATSATASWVAAVVTALARPAP
jgi:transposase-like protein